MAVLFLHPLQSVAQAAWRVISPEVAADGRVTFRFVDPNAKQVSVSVEGSAASLPMTRDDTGKWSVTTQPMPPDLYGYQFIADGVPLVDPNNPQLKPNLVDLSNLVHVAGSTPTLWEVQDVPHGEIHQHFYKSNVVGDQRDYYVYTPPGYDPKAKKKYPVLYLLHGYSDDASAWTAVGKANYILDNLIAQGKVEPMLIVMPLGYGAPEILKRAWAAPFDDQALRDKNFTKFREALLTEVMPQVEAQYHVSADRQDRAIAGLSMGGAESLLTGLNNLDKFAYVGAFSSGGLDKNFPSDFPSLTAKDAANLRVLWIACGTDDHLIAVNRELKSYLKSQNVPFTDVETPGMHTWMVWRRNLIAFTPLLFRK